MSFTGNKDDFQSPAPPSLAFPLPPAPYRTSPRGAGGEIAEGNDSELPGR